MNSSVKSQKLRVTGYARNRARGGFTLIELLVVVAIIGLLASVVFASLGGTRKNARINSAHASLRNIATSMALCVDEGFTLTALTSDSQDGGKAFVCSDQTTGIRTQYGSLPSNWYYCDAAGTGNCGAKASKFTGSDWQIIALSSATNDNTVITCNASTCEKSAP